MTRTKKSTPAYRRRVAAAALAAEQAKSAAKVKTEIVLDNEEAEVLEQVTAIAGEPLKVIKDV